MASAQITTAPEDPTGLKSYDMSFRRGLLPPNDPVTRLPSQLAACQERLAANLSEVRTGRTPFLSDLA